MGTDRRAPQSEPSQNAVKTFKLKDDGKQNLELQVKVDTNLVKTDTTEQFDELIKRTNSQFRTNNCF